MYMVGLGNNRNSIDDTQKSSQVLIRCLVDAQWVHNHVQLMDT